MVTKFTYDSYGNNTEIEYPSGVVISKIYDNNGYLSEIWHGSEMLWKLNSSNERGQPVNYNLGSTSNNLQVSFTYDAQGRVSVITTGQKKQTLSFDPASGNLLSRDYRIVNSQTGLTEVFEYDNMNRLINSIIGNDTISVGYADNGNITGKSDAGDYTYDPSRIHAVTSISGNPATINLTAQDISYNSFNLTTDITEGDSTYQILYNPLNQRIRTTFSPGGNATVTTTYYSGGYEKKVTGEATKELHYITSPFGLVAIIVKDEDTTRTYFVETDHLGSIIGLINPDKTYADSASFDPWGRRRNPADWSYNNVPAPQITQRGFTGHEHLDAFGLINMNGRMYDPVLGRFLGVDPILQNSDNSQNYNGYSYCINNPLNKYDKNGFKYDETPFQFDDQRTISNSSYEYWYLIHSMDGKDLTYYEKMGLLNETLDPLEIERAQRQRQEKNKGNPDVVIVLVQIGNLLIPVPIIAPQSLGNKKDPANKFDASRLSYKIKNHVVTINNKDLYTKDWSIKAPHLVADAIKQFYKQKIGSELDINTESLGLEIYIHAIFSKNGILKSHTDNADCGEYIVDSNRFI